MYREFRLVYHGVYRWHQKISMISLNSMAVCCCSYYNIYCPNFSNDNCGPTAAMHVLQLCFCRSCNSVLSAFASGKHSIICTTDSECALIAKGYKSDALWHTFCPSAIPQCIKSVICCYLQ